MIIFLWCHYFSLSEKENIISEIIRQDPIDTKDIERLSQKSSRYFIPHNQGVCRRYAIILYSSKEREGAVQEAEDMRQALEVARFQVIMYEWCNTDEVILQLHYILRGIMANCSLLTVCTMSHGYRGVLTDTEGNKLPINRIFDVLATSLPFYIPLVSTLFHSPFCFQTSSIKSHLNKFCNKFYSSPWIFWKAFFWRWDT